MTPQPVSKKHIKGKRIRAKRFKRLLAKPGYNKIKIFIETGTWEGIQNKIATDSNKFDIIYGIELDNHWYEITKELNPKSIIIHGDTVIELPKILEKHSNEPLFIYLDAHYCVTNPPIAKSEFPLWKELQLIKDRGMSDIVAIDDVKNFGVDRDGYNEWETITIENINNLFGDSIVDCLISDGAYIIYLKGLYGVVR